jgi:hypothetical protein
MHTQNEQDQEWKVCVSSCYNLDPQKIKIWHTKFFSRLLDSVKFIMFKIIYSMHFESSIFLSNVPTNALTVHDVTVAILLQLVSS